jgi:hypothetical protein
MSVSCLTYIIDSASCHLFPQRNVKCSSTKSHSTPFGNHLLPAAILPQCDKATNGKLNTATQPKRLEHFVLDRTIGSLKQTPVCFSQRYELHPDLSMVVWECSIQPVCAKLDAKLWWKSVCKWLAQPYKSSQGKIYRYRRDRKSTRTAPSLRNGLQTCCLAALRKALRLLPDAAQP